MVNVAGRWGVVKRHIDKVRARKAHTKNEQERAICDIGEVEGGQAAE